MDRFTGTENLTEALEQMYNKLSRIGHVRINVLIFIYNIVNEMSTKIFIK